MNKRIRDKNTIGIIALSVIEILAGTITLIYIKPAGITGALAIIFMFFSILLVLTGALTFLLNKIGWYLQFTSVFTLPFVLFVFFMMRFKRVIMIELMVISFVFICINIFFFTRHKIKEQFMVKNGISPFLWKILVILIFARAFICDYVSLNISLSYALLLAFFSIAYLFLHENKLSLPRYFQFFFILFLCAAIVSIENSKYLYWSINEIYMYIPNIFIFYAANKIDRKQGLQLLYWITCISFVICIYAFRQYFFGLEDLINYLRKTHMDKYLSPFILQKRPFSTFPSPNIFASYLIIMFFLGLGFLQADFPKKGIKAYFMSLNLIVIIVALILTQSLGAIFSLVVTCSFFIYFQIARKEKAGFMLILAVILAIVLFFAKQKFLWIFGFENPGNSLLQRWYYWLISLRIIKDHFLFGVGWRNMGAVYNLYQFESANLTHYSHNVFLQLMVETGILGFVSFAGIVFIFFKKGFASIKKCVGNQMVQLGIFCAGIAFLFHNMVDLSFYFSQVSFFWWFILGFVLREPVS